MTITNLLINKLSQTFACLTSLTTCLFFLSSFLIYFNMTGRSPGRGQGCGRGRGKRNNNLKDDIINNGTLKNKRKKSSSDDNSDEENRKEKSLPSHSHSLEQNVETFQPNLQTSITTTS